MKKVFQMIDEAKAVSFSIFDTLIVRLYRQPTDLFKHLEQSFQLDGFKEARIAAEQTARAKAVTQGRHEITLDEIYGEMHSPYRDMAQKEIQLEIQMCKANPEMKALFGDVLSRDIPVFISSDTYLPKDVIEAILSNAGYQGYQKLLLSSETMRPKETGEMYEDLIATAGIPAGSILHIGSHRHTDYELAGNAGLQAFYYEPVKRTVGQNQNSAFFAVLNRYADHEVSLSILEGLTVLRSVSRRMENYWEDFGYKYMGILTYGYMKWIKECLDKLGLKKVYFMLHEGCIMKRVFDILYPEFETHEVYIPSLFKEGKTEQKTANDCLKELDLFEGTAVIVDYDVDVSFLKEMKNVSRLQGYDTEYIAFCLVTHPCNTDQIHVESYFSNDGYPGSSGNDDLIVDDTFTNQILELAFSVSHPSISKQKIQNVKTADTIHEQERMEISSRIMAGVIDFTMEMHELEQGFPIAVSREAAAAPIEYLSRYITRSDQAQIEQVFYFPEIENCGVCRPIFRQGRPVIGVINPWPGDMSAESELISRLKRTAEEHQIGFVTLDNFGFILDKDQKRTSQRVAEEELSFVITTHYETHKALNAFYYHGVWNPPEIPLNLDHYTQRITNNYLMNEDFLIYDSGGMTNHLRSMLMNCPRTLEGASSLTTTSFPLSSILPPRLDAPVMFYCGMNWERVVHGTNRHEGLFKLLDDTQKVKFFGPDRVETWGGMRPWAGYKCYQGSIPFDGFSILKEINRCGICLVLSSDIHRRAGAATNRTYEACAAGAVIISDENEFMLRYFKDAALFIDYNKNDPKDTFRQIMEKYDWIVEHPDEALALATKAQKIFIEKFALDTQLDKLIKNHPARFAQIQKDLYARDNSKKVLVTFVLDTQDLSEAKPKLEHLFQNIHGQLYRNIELGIAVDLPLCGEIESFCKTRCACAHIVAIELFDKKGSRRLTNGQVVRQLQKQIAHTYYINTTAEEFWFFDHLTSMVRTIEDSGALCAYSGSAFEDMEGFRRINFFEILDSGHLYYMNKPERSLVSGQFLFHKNAHSLIPDFLFDNLDGEEHLAYAGLIRYKHRGKMAFTKRMSLYFIQEEDDSPNMVVPSVMQDRFIQDLIRLDIPDESLSGGGGVSKKTVLNVLLFMPIKSYIRLRYYRFRMRRLVAGSKKYKKLEAKYTAILKQYNKFWGI